MLVKIEARILIFPGTDFHFPSMSVPLGTFLGSGTTGVNSLPKTVNRQHCGCDLNPGPTAHECSTLTTRLPEPPLTYLCTVGVYSGSVYLTNWNTKMKARNATAPTTDDATIIGVLSAQMSYCTYCIMID